MRTVPSQLCGKGRSLLGTVFCVSHPIMSMKSPPMSPASGEERREAITPDETELM